MEQPPAHELHNPELLRLIPPQSRRLIEIGCSSGALAREFKKIAPDCDYLGIEIDPAYAKLAERHCDRSLVLDIEHTLEHLVEPWVVLARIRERIPAAGSVVACIPNAQHWSLQARLSIGDFRYEEVGLLARTHLRWFTRQTIIELFEQAGFRIAEALPRIFDEPHRERILPVIEQMARQLEVDPKVAVSDALALQYVVRAEPRT